MRFIRSAFATESPFNLILYGEEAGVRRAKVLCGQGMMRGKSNKTRRGSEGTPGRGTSGIRRGEGSKEVGKRNKRRQGG